MPLRLMIMANHRHTMIRRSLQETKSTARQTTSRTIPNNSRMDPWHQHYFHHTQIEKGSIPSKYYDSGRTRSRLGMHLGLSGSGRTGLQIHEPSLSILQHSYGSGVMLNAATRGRTGDMFGKINIIERIHRAQRLSWWGNNSNNRSAGAISHVVWREPRNITGHRVWCDARSQLGVRK